MTLDPDRRSLVIGAGLGLGALALPGMVRAETVKKQTDAPAARLSKGPTIMNMTSPRPFHDPLVQEMTLTSGINGRSYILRVRVPESYAASGADYPVMVVLDGEGLFNLVSDLAPIEVGWSRAPLDREAHPVPEVIIASVFLPRDPADPFRRNFEYMPAMAPDSEAPSSRDYMHKVEKLFGVKMKFGGAENFFQILAKEMLPAIEKTYRTDPSRRILVGSSASGSFAAYSLFKQPDLFTDYMIISPAVPPEIFRMEAEWNAAHDDLPARVLLTAGEREVSEPLGIFSATAKLSEVLTNRRYAKFDLETWIVPGANHVQTQAPSISRGLSRLGMAG
jgi:predicted alpha/beta superfamily hydrolase